MAEQKAPVKAKVAKTAKRRAAEAFEKGLVRVNLPEVGDGAESETVKVDQTVPVGINGDFMIVTRGPGAKVTPDMFVLMAQSGRFKGL